MALLFQPERQPTEYVHLLLNVGYRVTAEDFVLAEIAEVLRSPAGNTLKNVILQQQGKVPILSQICRSGIRKHLNYYHGGLGMVRTISELPLPRKLKEFLLLKEELRTT